MKKSTVNRTVGNQFEEELCGLLAEHGWWAHNMAQNQTGQPADVIAVKNNIAVLIDCKDVKTIVSRCPVLSATRKGL